MDKKDIFEKKTAGIVSGMNAARFRNATGAERKKVDLAGIFREHNIQL